MMPLMMAEMVLLCRSEGNWGEYGLSKAAVNCYTIELGKSGVTFSVSFSKFYV